MTTSEERRAAVVIIGGGPVGMALALLLGGFGVDFVLLERNPGTTDHPKARGIYHRAMELFRKLGIEDRIRSRGLPVAGDTLVVCESIAGSELARTEPEPPRPDLTPCHKSMVSQDVVEEELFAALQRSFADRLHFSTEAIGLHQDDEGVLVRARSMESRVESTWRADYVVAADGAGSETREWVDIEMVGSPRQAIWRNEFWRADLSRFPATRSCWVFQIVPPDPAVPISQILSTNASDRWLSSLAVGDGTGARFEPLTPSDLVAFIRGQVGVPDLEVELLGGTTWSMIRQVAKTFRRGRVLLAGDAAHRIPPVGGFGLNTGLEDAHNLAWKLAFVLNGLASHDLLDTYERERRPVASSNAEWSEQNAKRTAIGSAMRSGNQDRVSFWLAELQKNYHVIGRSLGYCYADGALIPDGSVPIPSDTATYMPSDTPGARFPHQWIDEDHHTSTLDWFDRDLVLVAGDDGAATWANAASTVSEKLRIPVTVQCLPALGAETGIRIGARGAALVRPDGHVAWRLPWMPRDPKSRLADALSNLFPGDR